MNARELRDDSSIGTEELDSSSNVVFSPLSLLTALAMAYLGSKHTTARQLEKIFGLTEDSVANQEILKAVLTEAAKEEKQMLHVANRMYLHQKLQVEQEFLGRITSHFGTSLGSVNFRDSAGACREINSWVSSQTENKINTLVSEDIITDKTKLVLVSAVYFKSKWKEAFKNSLTHAAPFYLADGTPRLVQTMEIQSKFRMAHFPDLACRLLEMPYDSDRLRFYILLPDALNGISALEKLLTSSALTSFFASELPAVSVRVTLPRFRIEASLSAVEALEKLGLKDLFSERDCDLTDISQTTELFVSAVAHRANIEVTEEGTEATAATAAVGRQKRSLPIDDEEFEANHPFIFFIRDQLTGIILFYGRLLEPENSSNSMLKEEL